MIIVLIEKFYKLKPTILFMSKQEGITVKKDQDFSEWYTQVIIKSDLADYSPVSGCIIFKPSSYSLWEKIKEEADKRFKRLGIKNVYFPLLIPESLLKKESAHIKGFSPEVAWVTHAGDTKLDERLAIRPTSETIMYEAYARWIRSWRDLPLRLNQWNSVIRWEFKHPVPFLRTREFLWNEGHTVFATKEQAEKEKDEITNIYKEILKDYMALPSLLGRKTDKEKFAGAEYTISFELYLPNGRAIQGPDFHHDSQIFAKAFNIKFMDKDGKEKYPYQNTWAITTRMIGVMVAIHSDDKGLVIPPKLAENKIVIVPIPIDSKEKILKLSKELSKKLEKFNPILDDREEYTPGWKFNEWELKGMPIRIEIGPRDLKEKAVTILRRDTLQKEKVKLTKLTKYIEKTLEEMHNNLYKKAKSLLKKNIVSIDNINNFKKAIDNKKIVFVPWCENQKCEESIKEKTSAKSLNIPLKQPKIKGKKCINCNKEAKLMLYFGKSY